MTRDDRNGGVEGLKIDDEIRFLNVIMTAVIHPQNIGIVGSAGMGFNGDW